MHWFEQTIINIFCDICMHLCKNVSGCVSNAGWMDLVPDPDSEKESRIPFHSVHFFQSVMASRPMTTINARATSSVPWISMK
mmetsp:Transcript_12304/g.28863  ORF Transcript_12304/g.28863 Transcript_12304/m.28863 type:complete len:82 (+) Transcript_12304:195-440(+)